MFVCVFGFGWHSVHTKTTPNPHTHRAGSFSGYSCDIWAAGVCLWAFVFGTLPFQLEDSPDDLFEAICEREPAFPDTKVRMCICIYLLER